MKIKSIDDISVNEICKHACVGHSTFYRRYRDKYDLMNSSYLKLMEKTILQYPSNPSWKEEVYEIYRVIGEHSEFFFNALSSNSQNGLRKLIFDRTFQLYIDVVMKNGMDTSNPINIMSLNAHINGNLHMTIEWLKDTSVISLDDLVKIFVEDIPMRIQPYFNLPGIKE